MPNYDLPNPAPEPLRGVQLFVNSIDREHDREWSPAWLEGAGGDAPELLLPEVLPPPLPVPPQAADRASMDNPSKARLRVFKAMGNIDCTYLVG